MWLSLPAFCRSITSSCDPVQALSNTLRLLALLLPQMVEPTGKRRKRRAERWRNGRSDVNPHPWKEISSRAETPPSAQETKETEGPRKQYIPPYEEATHSNKRSIFTPPLIPPRITPSRDPSAHLPPLPQHQPPRRDPHSRPQALLPLPQERLLPRPLPRRREQHPPQEQSLLNLHRLSTRPPRKPYGTQTPNPLWRPSPKSVNASISLSPPEMADLPLCQRSPSISCSSTTTTG